jgi:hypothetical protein
MLVPTLLSHTKLIKRPEQAGQFYDRLPETHAQLKIGHYTCNRHQQHGAAAVTNKKHGAAAVAAGKALMHPVHHSTTHRLADLATNQDGSEPVFTLHYSTLTQGMSPRPRLVYRIP